MFIEGFTRRVSWLALLSGLGAVSVPASGLAQEAPQVITLQRAVEIALERNPTVQQAENSARLSALTVLQQQRQLLPDVNLNTGTGIPYGTPGASADPSLTAGISASMQVGNIYSTVANLRQARLNEEGSLHNLDRSRQTVVFNVMSNYLSLIEAEEQLAVQERNLATVEAQEAQIAAYVEAGRRPISDLYQQQASTASARLSLVQAQRGLIVTRMNMIRNLQLDPFGEYEFVVPELGPLSTTFESLDLQEITQQALAQRPDLQASAISLNSAEQGLKIASATRWPSVSLQLGYNTGNFNSNATGDFFNQLDRGRRGNLSLNVSVPIVDLTYGITRERAQISLENARISLDNTRLAVITEVQTAYLDLQLAEEQLLVAEAQLQAAQRAFEMAQERYDVQVATFVELTQSQTALLRAESSLVNARYELVFRSRLMDYYLGNLDVSAAS